jgi:hypothetical protein
VLIHGAHRVGSEQQADRRQVAESGCGAQRLAAPRRIWHRVGKEHLQAANGSGFDRHAKCHAALIRVGEDLARLRRHHEQLQSSVVSSRHNISDKCLQVGDVPLRSVVGPGADVVSVSNIRISDSIPKLQKLPMYG